MSAGPRERALARLLALLEARPEVVGVVLLGSGATGFKDRYSDVDLLVILDDSAIFALAYEKIKQPMLAALDVLFHFEIMRGSEEMLFVGMLADYLEVDMSIVIQRALVFRDADYKILLDRTGVLPAVLDDAFSETQTIAPRRAYMEIVERIWQPVLRCIAAVQRGETWRAIHMLETIREQIVILAGLNHKINTRGYSGVDQLPEMFLVNLRHTLPNGTNPPALRRALRHAVQMFFAEATVLEDKLRISLAPKMRDVLMRYIEIES
jgi:predicted nucleotidyltransferase